MTTARMNSESLRLGDAGQRIKLAALGLGLGGVVLSAGLYPFTPHDRFFRSYLVAFMLVLGICLAALLFTMIFHATRAGWSVTIRRILEVMAGNLMWLWVLFVPIAVAMLASSSTHLYEWAIPSAVENDELLQHKAAFLNPTFWLIRAAIYFAIWGLLARFFYRHSVAQDETGDLEHTHRLQRLAPVGILLWALTTTLAAIDWMMALEPHWFSTIFGVYFFAASCAACFSTLILAVYLLQRAGKLTTQVTTEHYQDMGKMLFAFGVVFWAYIAYSQFMLIWYANIPEETMWFIIRGRGGWWTLSMLLLFGHFVIPFLAIMSRHPKRRKPVIAAAGGWMLFMAFVDFYWIIVPQVPLDLLAGIQADLGAGYPAFVSAFENGLVPAEVLAAKGLSPEAQLTYRDVYGFHPHLVDLTCLAALLGLFVAGTVHRLGRCALTPVRDPRLHEALAFENM